MPAKSIGARASPRNAPPSMMALTGIKKVTNIRFTAPAEARMRKNRT